MKLINALFLYCLLALQPAWSAGIALKVGSHSIQAEIASTPESRMTGLMQRDHLCADCGMLFIFPKADRHNFWMKNTPLPLSIAFIAADGSILNITEMQPNSTDIHNAQGDALYALEMNRNWFAKNGIKAGDKTQGLKLAPQGR
jgi:hypothetical protein